MDVLDVIRGYYDNNLYLLLIDTIDTTEKLMIR